MATNAPNSKILPLAAGLAGGYLQNRLTGKIVGRLNGRGGFVQRTLVSLVVSWLVGKLVRRGQQWLTDGRKSSA